MSAKPGIIQGAHVLAAMLAFFGAVIAVNITFVVFAVQSFPGEDVRRSYLQGLNYNATLAERREQAAMGWRAETALRGQHDATIVEVTILDGAGAPVDGLTTSGELRWPTNGRFDRALSFEAQGRGRYVAHLRDLSSGRWILRGRAERTDGRALDFEAELTWRS